jgi:hypothetical protein
VNSDSFVVNEDGTFANAGKACFTSTPATTKKKDQRSRHLDLEEGEMGMDNSECRIPSEFTALSESGIWEYNERAESHFTYGLASPSDSDVDEGDSGPPEPAAKVDEPEIDGLIGKIEVQSGSNFKIHRVAAENGPQGRPKRRRTRVKYAESSSDNQDEPNVDLETESE